MIFVILGAAFVIYVIYSLSSIKNKLDLLLRQHNINEYGIKEVSNDEIEQELENINKKI